MFYGESLWNILLAMALMLWQTKARLVRSQTLSLSERPFIKAAKRQERATYALCMSTSHQTLSH